ncbi:helix-turn-helix transcriptional regulator [Desulfovibrio sp. OttesenSCG-928-I05]|nr:helix-turn-helix transcriptional regulator [Desulfovibrio sp. OttesenSCG-928-I05]
MPLSFADFVRRLREKTDLATQMDIAAALGVNRSAITQAKKRDAVPQKWVLALSRSHGLSPDWLEFGKGPSRLRDLNDVRTMHAERTGRTEEAALPSPLAFAATERFQGEIIAVPQVQAKLCAGGGSFELEAVPVAEHPFPLSWLSRMGRPSAMVFMDVIGNSMEPGIADGDMVLVDQSAVTPMPRSIMAVGYDDAIFIKRLERHGNGVHLVSDNPEYPPITIRGDEMEQLRIIGKVVWLCRDCH